MAGKHEFSDISDVRKQNIKMAANIFLWTVFAALLNFIIYMSFTMIFTGLSTRNIGERIFEIDENGSRIVITEIYNDETTTKNTEQTTAAGTGTQTTAAGKTTTTGTASTTTTIPGRYKEIIRSDFPSGASLALDIISQTFLLVLFIAMAYSKLWTMGDKDSNLVQYKHLDEDKLRGLKIGLMAALPSFILYFILILSKLKVIAAKYFFFYRLLNVTFMPIVTRMAGKSVTSSVDVSWPALFGMLLTLAVLPLTCYIAYLLGYKNISLGEKFVYVDQNKRRKNRRR